MEETGLTFAHVAPDYLPGLATLALLDVADVCFLDAGLQYSRQSFHNRTRLRTPDGVQWITVPVIGGQFGRSLSDTRIDYSAPWIRKHLKALRFNYASAPFYDHYVPAIGEILHQRHATLGPLNSAILERLHGFLGLKCRLVHGAPDVGNESGSLSKFGRLGRRIVLDEGRRSTSVPPRETLRLVYDYPSYRQNFEGFESGMSIIDLLFTSGPEAGPILKSGIRRIDAPA